MPDASTPTLTQGIYPHLSYEDYDAIPARRPSEAKKARRSLRHLRHELDQPKDTDAIRVGQAGHTLSFEPSKFTDGYHVAPDGVRRDVRTEKWKAEIARAAGRTIMKAEEYTNAAGIAQAVRNHPIAGQIVAGEPRLAEFTAVWWHEAAGCMCKARVDLLASTAFGNFIVDLKTTTDVREEAFRRRIVDNGHHIQAGMVREGLQIIKPTDKPRQWLWICVEQTPPHELMIYRASEALLAQGAAEAAEVLPDVQRAFDTGEWPGYPTDIYTIDLPKWEQREEFYGGI